MDHMDWFDPEGADATEEIRAINKAMKVGGRVLLRSAGLKPWYIANFTAQGFKCKRVAGRTAGKCIDRSVMYHIRTLTVNADDARVGPSQYVCVYVDVY